MNVLRESRGVRVSGRSACRGVVLLAVAAVLVSACATDRSSTSSGSSGSSDGASTTSAVAGAQENAAASGVVCHDWPAGTTVVPCAVDAMGPGGGRVFYDAGSVQPWGRFLEVAPQYWGRETGSLCQLLCGAADGVEKETTDLMQRGVGYYVCRADGHPVLFTGEAADTAWAIGAGRRNTEVLSANPECDGSESTLTKAMGYQGGGLSDWYLPSGGELTELCRYTGRNAIGGFVSSTQTVNGYGSSTVGPSGDHTVFFGVDFSDAPTCTRKELQTKSGDFYVGVSVRPIRAFA